MNRSQWRLRGLTEAGWLAHTDPLRMPKVFHRPPHRKCAFLACAYVLDSPGGFQHPFSRRVAETLRRAVTDSPFPANLVAALRGALARDFPNNFAPTWYSYQLAPKGVAEIGSERYQLDGFLGALTRNTPPSRGAVNSVAESCLIRVRNTAHATARQVLDALRREFARPTAPKPPAGLARPDLRDAVLAFFPDGEREALAAEPWTGDQIPFPIQNRYCALVAEQAASAAGAQMAGLVREIFGNPFRPPEIEPHWRWQNHAAVWHIAEQIAATGNFADLPILADALEDAGCADEELLRHCRDERAHVPGCWALDAVLGR